MKKVSSFSLYKKFKKRFTLSNVQMGLTNRCNEKCIHCLEDKTKGELTTQQIKNALVQLKELGCFEIIFTGGEVFLRKDIFEILNFAKKLGLGQRILSNGTLINKKHAKFLEKLNPLEVQISLYGADADTHEYVTKFPGSFNKTVRAISLLKDYKINLTIATTVMCHNFKQAPLMKRMAQDQGYSISFDFIIRPAVSGSLHPLSHRVTNKQIGQAYDLNLLPFVDRNKNLRPIKPQEIFVNTLGKTHAYISPIGEVFLNVLLRVKIGDLKKDSLHHIWHSSQKLKQLRKLKLSDFECSKCKYVLRCCWEPGLSLAEHGSLFKKPKEMCRFIRVITKKQQDSIANGKS